MPLRIRRKLYGNRTVRHNFPWFWCCLLSFDQGDQAEDPEVKKNRNPIPLAGSGWGDGAVLDQVYFGRSREKGETVMIHISGKTPEISQKTVMAASGPRSFS